MTDSRTSDLVALLPLPDGLDQRLLRAIEARVGQCLADFAVRSMPGQGLVLSGRTHSYFVKQVAQHLAIQITGLRVCANRIEVSRDR
jgi:hypothetical protein